MNFALVRVEPGLQQAALSTGTSAKSAGDGFVTPGIDHNSREVGADAGGFDQEALRTRRSRGRMRELLRPPAAHGELS